MRAFLGLVAMVLLVGATGCYSSHYVPRRSARLTEVIINGQPKYLRDGVTYEVGLFDDDLDRAVAGNPQAVAAAQSYHEHQVRGFLVGIGGLACAEVGGIIMLAEAGLDDTYQPSTAFSVVTIACAAATVLGLMDVAAAPPYKTDAVNLFNDSVTAPVELPPGVAPTP